MLPSHFSLLTSLFLCLPTALYAQLPPGDMDPLLGPATLVNQGMGMTDEIRLALAPEPPHAVIGRLAGEWRVTGTARPDADPVSEVARIRPLMGGAWFEVQLLTNGDVSRLAHIGYDGYRGSLAMWEIGQGFTSPQVRAGEIRADGGELHFWRQYTIRRRGEPALVRERVVVTFLSPDRLRWRSVETIGSGEERMLRDVEFSRVPSRGREN